MPRPYHRPAVRRIQHEPVPSAHDLGRVDANTGPGSARPPQDLGRPWRRRPTPRRGPTSSPAMPGPPRPPRGIFAGRPRPASSMTPLRGSRGPACRILMGCCATCWSRRSVRARRGWVATRTAAPSSTPPCGWPRAGAPEGHRPWGTPGHRPAASTGQQRIGSASKWPGRRPCATPRRRSGARPCGTRTAPLSRQGDGRPGSAPGAARPRSPPRSAAPSPTRPRAPGRDRVPDRAVHVHRAAVDRRGAALALGLLADPGRLAAHATAAQGTRRCGKYPVIAGRFSAPKMSTRPAGEVARRCPSCGAGMAEQRDAPALLGLERLPVRSREAVSDGGTSSHNTMVPALHAPHR